MMEGRIVITIEFGNAAMQTRGQTARALVRLAERIASGDQPSKVMDANGNSVGTVKWEDA